MTQAIPLPGALQREGPLHRAEGARARHSAGRTLAVRCLSALWRGAVVLVLLAAVSTVLLAVILPRVGGATPYTVLTGSMTPGLPPGTLVVVRPVPVDEIGVGSVVTYQLESGRPAVVTHRVIGVSFANGERIFQTQGDANPAPDAEWVREVQLRGKLWYAVPGLGYVSSAVSSQQREAVKYAAAAALLGYAAFMFTSALRERLRDRLAGADAAGTAEP